MRDKQQLKEVADIIMGQSPDSNYCNENGNGLPFLQGCGEFGKKFPLIRNYCTLPKKKSPKQSILISVRAPVGDINIAQQNVVIGRGLAGIIPKNIDKDFLFYSIVQFKHQLRRVSQGTTFEAISSKDLQNFAINFFDKEHQRKIAKILNTVEAVIEKTEAGIAKYQAIKLGMMKDLFTRGIDPKSGKLRLSQKDAPQLYKETEVGWIPKEWEIECLGDLVIGKGVYGINAAAVKYDPEKYAYLRITDISENGFFIPEGRKSVDHSEARNFLLSEGDIVFARTGNSTGKTYLYDKKDGKLVFAGFLIKFHPNPNCLLPGFIKFYTETNWYWNWVKIYSARTGQPGINENEYGKLPLPIPPVVEQDFIVQKLISINTKIEAENRTLSKHQSLKKGLMQDLLTGKVEVEV